MIYWDTEKKYASPISLSLLSSAGLPPIIGKKTARVNKCDAKNTEMALI